MNRTTATIAHSAIQSKSIWTKIQDRKERTVWNAMMIAEQDDNMANKEKVQMIIDAVQEALKEEKIAFGAMQTLDRFDLL
jgi:archaellin